MKTHEAEAILKYCADIPRRLSIIRRQCAALDDEVDTLKGINMDGMPGGGQPGDSTAAMACKMIWALATGRAVWNVSRLF